MPRSEHLADMPTESLHEEREACLLLTTDDYAGSERVKEVHADWADRISDEIDGRANDDRKGHTMADTRTYTSRMPDDRAITFADIRVGWWVQVYVGPWPYDTVCGYVTAVHGGGAITANIDGQGSRFVPRRRLCSTLRPVDD